MKPWLSERFKKKKKERSPGGELSKGCRKRKERERTSRWRLIERLIERERERERDSTRGDEYDNGEQEEEQEEQKIRIK